MADSDKDKKPGKPPKIKLSSASGDGLKKPTPPAGKGKETARIDLSEAKTNLESAKTDLDGARADLASAAPDDTTRIDLPKPPSLIKPKGKTETSKLDMASAHPAGEKDDTSRIDLPGRKSETARVSLSDARPVETADQHGETQPIEAPANEKDDTFRIELDDSKPAADDGGDFSPATSGIETVTEEDRERILKQSTMRVDLAEDAGDEQAPATANQTMRVELDDGTSGPSSKTARVAAPAEPAAPAVPPSAVGTARIPLDDDDTGGDDVLKRRGAAAAAAAAAAPQEVVAPDPDDIDDSVLPPSQTARVAPPVEAEKSKTARIEVPSELSTPGTGRPKTIRIKRADSTAGPLQAPVPEPTVKRGSKGKKGKKPTIKTDEIGTLYSAVALVAVVVVAIVIYVLVAQVLDPSLPWIGKVSL